LALVGKSPLINSGIQKKESMVINTSTDEKAQPNVSANKNCLIPPLQPIQQVDLPYAAIIGAIANGVKCYKTLG
jgi:hypothetical protein